MNMVEKTRTRRLVKRTKGWFWRSPYDEIVRFVGADRAAADAEILRLSLVAEAALKKEALFDQRKAYRDAYDRALSRAQKAKDPVMTVTEFDWLVERAGGHCEVTGIPFNWEIPRGQRKRLWAPSVDRIDCTRGYLLSNCRLVCVAVNVALNEFGLAPLLRIAHALSARHPADSAVA